MAKIVGNIVGLPNPQPDWNQTDITKADYIKNKPSYENCVHKTGDELIEGEKTFMEKTILTEIGSFNTRLPIYAPDIELEAYDSMVLKSRNGEPIKFEVGDKTYVLNNDGIFIESTGSDGGIEIKTIDAPITLRANGEYIFYDGTIYINGKSIFSAFDNIDELTVGKILGKDGTLQIVTDGTDIVSNSGVSIKASTTLSLEGDVLINDEVPASIKYVDEAIEDIDDKVVKKTGDEEIDGKKTFRETIVATRISSYDAKLPISASEVEISTNDGMFFESTNGYPIVFQVGDKTYSLYDNGMFEAEKISIKEITSGDDEVDVKLDGKEIATKEYVDEALNDIDGGNIEIDDVPTDGSTNAVSSGGAFTELFKKADKTYVDSSIQQAILDSWAEVIEP